MSEPLQGLYDDDRSITIEGSINGEVVIHITTDNYTLPIVVFADDLETLVAEAIHDAREALQ